MPAPITEWDGAQDFSQIEDIQDETIALLNDEVIDALADGMVSDHAIGTVGRGTVSTDSANDFWILYGCEISGTNPGLRTVSEGAILYQNQVYHVSGASVTTTGVQVVMWQLKDNGSDVHEVKELEIVAGTSGSKIYDEGSEFIHRFGEWIESDDNGGVSISFVSNTVITFSAESYKYRYRRMGNTLDLHFRASVTLTAGASNVTRFYIPMPNGFTKKNPSSGYHNIGTGGFDKTTPPVGTPMLTTNRDTGSEGNVITMLRNDLGIGSQIIMEGSGQLEVWGQLTLEIE